MDFLKTKNGKIVIAIFIVVIIFVVFKNDIQFFWYRSKNKLSGTNPPATTGQVTDTDWPDPDKLDVDLVLKNGVSGDEVKELQLILLQAGAELPRYGADGVFGSETEAALMSIRGVKEITLRQYGQF